MKCVAIDDEPMALEVIKKFAQRVGDLELETFTNPVVGIEHVKRTNPAYAQYAVDGFDLNAVDFLHKPFSFSRFEKAIEKVRQAIKLVNYSAAPPLDGKEITVKVEYKNVTIQLSSILYVQAMDNYVKIFTVDSRPVITQMSMKSLETLLPGDFMRVHKSYIVPKHRIESYSRTQLILTGGTEIPVGRAYADRVVSS